MFSALLFALPLVFAASAAAVPHTDGQKALPGLLSLLGSRQTVFGAAQRRPGWCDGELLEEGMLFGTWYSVFHSPEHGGVACMTLENLTGAPLNMVAAVYTMDGENFASDGRDGLPATSQAGPVRIAHVDETCWTWALVVDGDRAKTFGHRYCYGTRMDGAGDGP